MITAVILLNCERGKVNAVAQNLAEIPGITEVYSVAGRWDLVAMIRVRQDEELADLVTTRMLQVEGIRETETLIAFQAFSKHDLEAAFSLGGES
ncbi:MAG: Lrp/AsnC ligand binding domain-containing protein [Candidatus Eisenbacteria bacterium]|nr:Lrp/AsnC ligand binding domain-containing protein [Candidatus Eisenbacteria bacterium]